MSHDFLNCMCNKLEQRGNGLKVNQSIDYAGYTVDWKSSKIIQVTELLNKCLTK